MYKRLTSKDETSMFSAGFASLSLLDRDLPFGETMEHYEGSQTAIKNIIYEFKPPNKQFDADIAARSGGEKTIAGLALIFAMAMIKRPQMILLDEVDAHLDADNVDLLSSFLSQWKDSPQIVMISHKEQAVSKSDSLIGVTQQEYFQLPASEQGSDNQDLQKHKYLSAVTFSLDLRSFSN